MFRLMTKKRIGLLGLMIMVAAAGSVLVANLATGGWIFARARYALASRLARHSKVAKLEVPGVPGLKMFLHPDDKVVTYRIMSTGLWEPNETHWISSCVGKGDTFVDVGANVGYYTVIASRLVGKEGRVFAFEPDPTAFAILQKNVRLNGLRNVVLEQKAVSNKNGTIQLFLAEENKGDHRIYQTEEQRTAIEVEAVALDDYFKEYDGRIDFVKIDTQGAEGLILQGMRGLIRENERLVMAVEFWPYALNDLGCDAKEFLDTLRSDDLLFFDLGAGGPGTFGLYDVEAAPLLERFTVENQWFTNLLVVRGYADMQRLQRHAVGKLKALEVDTPELKAARRKWEDDLLTGIRRDPNGAPSLPPEVLAALRTPREDRTADQVDAIRAHFRSVTPLLAEARSEVKEARIAVRAFRRSVLDRGGTVVR